MYTRMDENGTCKSSEMILGHEYGNERLTSLLTI